MATTLGVTTFYLYPIVNDTSVISLSINDILERPLIVRKQIYANSGTGSVMCTLKKYYKLKNLYGIPKLATNLDNYCAETSGNPANNCVL